MNCPECRTRARWNGVLSHSPSCSLIDLETAKWYAAKHHETWVKCNERVNVFVEQARRWEGKFRVVCHENNKLRARARAKGAVSTPNEILDAGRAATNAYFKSLMDSGKDERDAEKILAATELTALRTRLADAENALQLAKVENNHNWMFQPIHEKTLSENVALREALAAIVEEAGSPTCIDYEYDHTPTAETRLERCGEIARVELAKLAKLADE